MSTPPEEPTRRLPPSEPLLPRVREREVVSADGAWLEELRDEVRSLKTAVVLLGVLAVTALGIAAWALLSNNDDSRGQTRQGASPARVSRLEGRVDAFESQIRRAPSKSALDDLKTEQKSLADRLVKLERDSAQQSDAASKESVDAIQQDVQDLQQRVDQIEQRQQDQGSTP